MSQSAGWGAPGPYGPYGGWAPPPPKPGIIPLAPLGLGDITGGAFSALGRCFGPLLGIATIVFLAVVLLAAGTGALAVHAVFEQADAVFDPPYGTSPASSDVSAVAVAFAVWFLVLLVVGMVALSVLAAACLVVVQEGVLGRRPRFGELWRRARSRVGPLTGVQLMTWLIFVGPFLALAAFPVASMIDNGGAEPSEASLGAFGLGLLLLLPLATWTYVRFSLAPAVVVLEGGGPVTALRRSATLVRGAWWRIFGVLLLLGAMGAVIGSFVSMPFTYGGVFGALVLMPAGSPEAAELVAPIVLGSVCYLLGTILGQFISLTLPQLTAGLLYVDRRIRTEDLAPVLAAAAGLRTPPPYPPPPYRA